MKEIEFKGLKEKVYVHEHKSGLITYMWVNEKVKSCFMSLTVPYGSVHTEFKVQNKKYKVPNGIAHFLEHIKFNESDDFTAHDFFYKTGADANAYTTFDHTTYTIYTTSSQEENLNHLLDYVYNPYFTKKIIQKEKGIIVEEANMTKDDVYSVAYFKHLQNLLKFSKYQNIITGEPEEIKEITLDDVLNVYNSFYHPANMFLCITGNINPYEMAKIIDNNLDQKEFGKFIKPSNICKKEVKEVVKDYEEMNLNVISPKVRYGVKLPKSKFKNYSDWQLNVIFKIILAMNFGATSDFKENLVNSGLITEMYATAQMIEDYIILFIVADTKYPKEVIPKIEEKLNDLNIDEKIIERKKKANIASIILSFDDVEGVNNSLVMDLIEYKSLNLDILDDIKNLDYTMFKEIKDNISLKESSILVINPLNDKEKNQPE